MGKESATTKCKVMKKKINQNDGEDVQDRQVGRWEGILVSLFFTVHIHTNSMSCSSKLLGQPWKLSNDDTTCGLSCGRKMQSPSRNE